jgi:hypothetical protein
MKFGEIEEKILLWIGGTVVFVGVLLFIYLQGWVFWRAWLWDVGSMLLGIALACGLIIMFVFALLYTGERKKREQLEQELQRLKKILGED